MRELDRIPVLDRVIDRRLTQVRAARQLGLSARQVRRLVRAYEERGAAGLASKQRGRPSNRRLSDALQARAVALVRQRYADFGPTLAAEKLSELHNVRVSVSTLRTWMVDAGIWLPRSKRATRPHQPRHRRACVGELVQIDGCEHR